MVYHIGFTADDGKGGMCKGGVIVSVPHDQAHTAVDSGAIYTLITDISLRGNSLNATGL